MIFDPSISLGSLIAGTGVMLSVIVAMWRNGLKLQIGLDRLERLEHQVSAMDTKVQQIAVMQQQLVDSKERMDSLEIRVRELERDNRAKA